MTEIGSRHKTASIFTPDFLKFSVSKVIIIDKNNIVIFVGSHLILNRALQLEQCCIDIWSAPPDQLDRSTWLNVRATGPWRKH